MLKLSRSQKRQRFIENNGIINPGITQLPCDASFRHYYRIEKPDGSNIMLMDAPPDKEDSRPYIRVAMHLASMGLSAPKILSGDEENGFLLIEDFGNDTYTQLLNRGISEIKLYETAIDVLIRLHLHPRATDIDIPHYNLDSLLEEAVILPDWFWPEIKYSACPPEIREKFLIAWKTVFINLDETPQSLVLRDYHVDNLMLLQDRNGIASCGLLDFQDALIGPCAYDLVSLLEDARRDVSADLTTIMLERYFNGIGDLDRDVFEEWYAVLGAQRHTKVAGIFSRLFRRDGKSVYLKHIPRVLKLLNHHLDVPGLSPVREWFDRYLPEYMESLSFVFDNK